MPNINITVAGKIATNTTPGVVIVCGNSDYTVTFDLDAEWANEPNRTARFVYYKDGLRLYNDAEITDGVAAVPKLSNIAYVEVGVYAGDLHTTTPAKVLCDRSILCGNAVEQITPEKKAALQAQIGDLSQLQTSAKDNLVAAINEATRAGITPAQIAALDGMFKIAAYTEGAATAYFAFQEAFGLLGVAATSITLSVSSLSFTEAGSKTIIATVKPSNTTDEVAWTTSNPGVATVVGGLITPVADGSCTITATAGSVSASCAVSVAFAEDAQTYTITNVLTNCASNNSTASIVAGGSYTATLTAGDGYTLDGAAISIVVNGEDVTDTAYSDGVITIQSVTGNVVITAAAVEEGAGDSGEVVMLKNISFDGTSYLDTEVIPESVNYRYVLGIQMPNKDLVLDKNFGGISMRDQTDPAKSAYWDIYWYATIGANNYNPDVPAVYVCESCMGIICGNGGISAGQDKGDGASTQSFDYPTYYNLDNGNQAMWLNEELTEPPVPGHFQTISATTDFTNQSNYTDDEHPIDSIWLGKVHVTGIMSSLATEANTYAGVKFYCFKVYDSDENLIADMRPAKRGNTVGMWDNARNKFFPAIGTANYEEVSA